MVLAAVVFDLYETLVANGPDRWLESFGRVCRLQGLAVEPQVLWDRWIVLERAFRKRRLDPVTMVASEPFESYQEVWTDCFRRVFAQMELAGDPDAAADECIHDLGRRPIFPDALEALRALDGRVAIGLLSNADVSFLQPVLEHHSIRRHFAAVVCSQEARAYKPHPSIFHRVLEELGVSPGQALQVGDTLHEDVRGAKLVGMRTAWVNRVGADADPALPQADHELRSLAELPSIVEAMSGAAS